MYCLEARPCGHRPWRTRRRAPERAIRMFSNSQVTRARPVALVVRRVWHFFGVEEKNPCSNTVRPEICFGSFSMEWWWEGRVRSVDASCQSGRKWEMLHRGQHRMTVIAKPGRGIGGKETARDGILPHRAAANVTTPFESSPQTGLTVSGGPLRPSV
jgi:hypothetical protein